MAITTQKTEDLVTRNVSVFEGKLNQTIPSTDRAFNRVLSVDLAMIETQLDRKLIHDAKQNLALTATNGGLDDLGQNGITGPRIPAEAAILTGTIPADTGKTLPQTVSFVGDSNGVRYFPDNSASESGGLITVTVVSEETGISGNLSIGGTLSISSQIAGIGSVLTVTVVDNVGAEKESDETYRARILNDLRTLKGGGNSSDYRMWSLSVAGVVGAYPYAGLPFGNPGTPSPPDRTVYIESSTDIDPDGIPPTSLLNEVRAAINTDPVTGRDNEPLGLVNERLYVEAIRRTVLFYEVRGLDVPASEESSIKSQIETALVSYSLGLKPYVEGLDFIGDKNDTVSDPSISELVQGIISSVGGSAQGVGFGLTPGVFIPLYTLGQGEMAKSGGVTYA
jgi:hypothetical protein